jgi:hypothetical protein
MKFSKETCKMFKAYNLRNVMLRKRSGFTTWELSFIFDETDGGVKQRLDMEVPQDSIRFILATPKLSDEVMFYLYKWNTGHCHIETFLRRINPSIEVAWCVLYNNASDNLDRAGMQCNQLKATLTKVSSTGVHEYTDTYFLDSSVSPV